MFEQTQLRVKRPARSQQLERSKLCLRCSLLHASLQTSENLWGDSTAAAEENNLHRFKQDYCVEHQTLVLDVIEIILKLLARILNRSSVGIFNLRPAGQSRRDQMALFVVRNFLRKLRNKVWPLGRGPTKSIRREKIPELWDLVYAKLPIILPTRVVRSSSTLAHNGPASLASARIERNFIRVKGSPFLPTRSCL